MDEWLIRTVMALHLQYNHFKRWIHLRHHLNYYTKLMIGKHLMKLVLFLLLSVYNPFSDRVEHPLHNILSPFLSVVDIC